MAEKVMPVLLITDLGSVEIHRELMIAAQA